MDVLHLCFGILGNILSVLQLLAPMITFRRITKNKSTEQFSAVPYIIGLMNGLLYTWYGLPMISQDNTLLCTINGITAIVQGAYVLLFLFYAPKDATRRTLWLVFGVVILTATVVLVSMFGIQNHKTKTIFCGIAGATSSVLMYGSPLSIMKVVIKTKSVEFMPFFLSFFGFLSGTCWFTYGLLGHDLFVAIPGGLGSALGLSQLILYFVYRKQKVAIVTDTTITSTLVVTTTVV
ncbi:hypothetical protein MKW94_013227 [Papaver nudicaule]|uniref:Bidirectional sugar transporter SWEET n=1 Tax=Papaver nudicaule TaxID=74823 RepID=A0AA41V9U5_PAPNU|nr:hypothetical protein [Papaver nudicaule]